MNLLTLHFDAINTGGNLMGERDEKFKLLLQQLIEEEIKRGSKKLSIRAAAYLIGLTESDLEEYVRNPFGNVQWNKLYKGEPAPIGIPLIVTIHDSIRNCNEIRYPVIYRKGFYSDKFAFYLYGDEERILHPEINKVLAWKEFPKTYEYFQ